MDFWVAGLMDSRVPGDDSGTARKQAPDNPFVQSSINPMLDWRVAVFPTGSGTG
jgi:hypothetical protein